MSEPAHESNSLTVQQQADDRLVDSLLLHLHDSNATASRQFRIDRVMGVINRRDRALVTSWARRSVWAMAAMILLAIGIVVINYGTSPAMASLDDIVMALSQPGDRSFRLTVEPPDTDSQSHHGIDHAILDLRQGGQYLLTRFTSNGSKLFDGYDGRQSWRVRRGEVVEVRDGLGAGRIPMPGSMSDVTLVDLPQTLANLRSDYNIARIEPASLSNSPTPIIPLTHLVAIRKSPAVKGAQTIEIWADPTTGMPQRIVFDQAKFQGSTEPRRLTFQLVSQAALPADWFTSRAHVAANSVGPTTNPGDLSLPFGRVSH